MNTCEVLSLKNEIKNLISQFYDELVDGNTENFLRIVTTSEVFKDNNSALLQLKTELQLNGIYNTGIEALIRPDKRGLIPESLKDFQIESSDDVLAKFRTNHQAVAQINQFFNKKAFKKCILDTSSNIDPNDRIVQNNSHLQKNIATLKNELLHDVMAIIEEISEEYSFDALYEKYGIDRFTQFNPFSESGTHVDAYYDAMEIIKSFVQNMLSPDLLSSVDFTSDEQDVTSSFFKSFIPLLNFDYFLDQQFGSIIKPDRRNAGMADRVKYELIYAADGSQQDIMGVSDYEYENALNFVSPTTLQVISVIPKVEISYSKAGQKMSFNKFGDTLSIPDIFQATAWLQLKMPQLIKYLDLQGIDFLGNPTKSLHDILKGIYDYINEDYSKSLDSPLSKFNVLAKTPGYQRQMRGLLKQSGNIVPTLMSLYEFLFNDSSRLDKHTVAISTINEQLGFSSKIDIISDIVRQMTSTVAPALIEYNANGTIWDRNQSKSPTRSNYLQKALSSKSYFVLSSFVRKAVINEVLSIAESSQLADVILQQASKHSLSEALKVAEFKKAIGRIFGIRKDFSLNLLKDLLIEAEQEFSGKNVLFNLFQEIAKSINTLREKAPTYSSFSDLYNAIRENVGGLISKIDFEVTERVLAPVLGSAPTPTLIDRQGHQLGVYRTTSLVFMYDRMMAKYKTSKTDSDSARPLRQRSNIYIDYPELMQQGTNSLYQSQVAIPLTMGSDADHNLEARKLPSFLQDLHAFVGEYVSLKQAKAQDGLSPMVAFQLGAYSDKTTLPQMVNNLKGRVSIRWDSTTKTSSLEQLLFGDKRKQAKLFYLYQSTQKLDLGINIVNSMYNMLSELGRMVKSGEGIPSYWYQSNGKEKSILDQVKDLLKNPNIKAFLKNYTDLSQVLESQELAKQFAAAEQSIYKYTGFENTQYVQSINSIKNTLFTLSSLLDKGLSSVSSKSNLPLHAFNLAAFRVGKGDPNTAIVQKLHFDNYKGNLGLNKMLWDEIQRDCDLTKVMPSATFNVDDQNIVSASGNISYTDQLVLEALNWKYFIDGKEMTFLQYLVDYFEQNKDFFTSGGVDQSNRIFFPIYDKDGHVDVKQLIGEYYKYLQGSNFLRHQSLDLSVKEPYLDGKGQLNLEDEVKDRTFGASKRNNTHTAPVKTFTMDMVNGVRRKTRLAVIQDVKGNVFNSIGADKTVDEWDGVGYTSPYQSRMESASLGHSHNVSVKKTFITPVHDYYAEELKWASNEITNHLIRSSQGSEVDLLKIYKKMHDEPFNQDITHWWNGEAEGYILIKGVLGKNLYAKDGFTYWRYDSIKSLGNNEYVIKKTEVDSKGNALSASVQEQVHIESIYDIYSALNGVNSMSLVDGNLKFSESIHDLIYNIVIYAGEIDSQGGSTLTQQDLIQPLADSFIHILATNSANKRGSALVNPRDFWYNDEKFYYTEIDLSTGGEQLNAEHESNKSRITRGTQLLQDLSQKGYTSETVTEVYKSIAQAMTISSDLFNEVLQVLEEAPENLSTLVAEKVVKALEIDGNNLETQSLIAAFKQEAEEAQEDFTLPLSLMVQDVIKSIAPELNHVIKQKDSGLMGVLNAASGFVQVYNLGGKVFTYGSLTGTNAYNLVRKYRAKIESIKNTYGLTTDQVVKTLLIAEFNDEGSIERVNIESFQKLLLNTSDSIYNTVLELFNSPEKTQGVLQKKTVTELHPGETFYGIDSTGNLHKHKVNSVAEIAQWKDTYSVVAVNKAIPVDLQPNIRQVTDASGHSENEYTTLESCFSSEVARVSKNVTPEGFVDATDSSMVTGLRLYLGTVLEDRTIEEYGFTPVTLRQLQEDMVNFKNHVQKFGFTLKSAVPQLVGIDGQFAGYSFESYYGGFDPRQSFEKQLQARIVIDKVQQGNLGQIIEGITYYLQSGKASKYKGEFLTNLLQTPGALETAVLNNPYYFFRFLPDSKEKLYTDYMNSSEFFVKITSQDTQTSQLIMPSVFKDQMKLFGKDISEVTYKDFKRAAPLYYKIPDTFVENGIIDVDLCVRTFDRQYNIVFTNDLEEESLNKFGTTLQKTDLTIDEQGNRLTREKGRVIYKTPSNSKFIIKRDNSTGIETLIIKRPAGKSDLMWEDVMTVLQSDQSLVSVQPFLSRSLQMSGQFEAVKKYLPRLKTLNTLPVFDNVYDQLISKLEEDNASATKLKNAAKTIQTFLSEQTANLKEAYSDQYAKSLYHSFIRSLDIIATRIPTQNMSSIMTMKAASLLDSEVNNVFVTKWQQWLQGADYDIDKAFILCYNFDDYGRFVRWSPLQKMYSAQVFETSLRIPLPTGKELSINNSIADPTLSIYVRDYLNVKTMDLFSHRFTDRAKENYIRELAARYNVKFHNYMLSDQDSIELAIISAILQRVGDADTMDIGNAYTQPELKLLDALLVRLNSHNSFRLSVEGINNYGTAKMHEVLNDPRNATTTYKSIDIATDAFEGPLDEYTWESYKVNVDNGHTISSMTQSAAVGKDGVGIGANGTKVYFTLLNYFNRQFNEDSPLSEEELISQNHFKVKKLTLTYTDKNTGNEQVYERWVGPISDTQLSPFQRSLYDSIIKAYGGEGLYLYDRDASQDVGALLSEAVDNAKKLNLDKLHADTDYFAMHIYLAMIGVEPRVIINYFNSPAFVSIINSVHNSTAEEKRVDASTFDNFPELKQIYLAAREISSLASILSINQGIKVEKDDIVSQKLKCGQMWSDAVRKYKDSIDRGYFVYSPDSIDNKNRQAANEALQKAGISLEDPFDFTKFLTDKAYQDAIVKSYKVMMEAFNVFDVILQAPHFLAMLRSYNSVLQTYAKTCKLLDFTMNEGPTKYDKNILGTNLQHIGEMSEDIGQALPESFRSKFVKDLEYIFNDKLVAEFFIRKVAPNRSFEYTWGNKTIECSFLSDNSLHHFVDFVNTLVIPGLFNLEGSDTNEFLLGLDINDESTKEGNIFYGFNENLGTMARKDFSAGNSNLAAIQEGFNKIKDIPLSALLGDTVRMKHKDMTVGDVLFLYDTIMKKASPRQHSIRSILYTLNVQGAIKFEFAQFARDVDKLIVKEILPSGKKVLERKEVLDITPKEVMSSILRYKAPTETSSTMDSSENVSEKILKFSGQEPVVYRVTKNGKIYNRYFLTMPYYSGNVEHITLVDKLKHLLLNNKLKVEIDLNCQ